MKLAIVSLVPDLGHILPLIRIAIEASKDDHEICFFIPDEAKHIVDKNFGNPQSFGTVLPEDSAILLRKLSDSHSLPNSFILNFLFSYNYIVPLKINVFSRIQDIKLAIRSFGPDLIVGDAHEFFTKAMYSIAADCKVPVILHHAPATNQRCRAPHLVSKFFYPKRYMLNFMYSALFSLESWSTKIFTRNKWKTRTEQALVLKEYEAQLDRTDSSGEGIEILFITTGLGALEEKYLSDLIEVKPDTLLMGPLPPTLDSGIPQDVISWLELDGGRPIIFVCFGTMASFSERQVKDVLDAAAELDVRLLWASKVNLLGELTYNSSDVRWEPWLPQPAILAHKAVKGFLSHAGGSSVQEALWYAQPLICVPQLWDQPYNGWVAERLGYGITIDKEAFTKERLIDALRIVLHSDKLRGNVDRLSAEVRSQGGSERIRTLMQETGRAGGEVLLRQKRSTAISSRGSEESS